MEEMKRESGWILQKGRNRDCQSSILFRFHMTEAIGGCLALIQVYRWGLSWKLVCVYAFFVVLLTIAFVDVDTRKIPDCSIVVLGVIGIWSIPLFPEIGLAQRGIGILCVSLPMFLITMVVPGGFGGGDIKLMAVCGLFLGYKLSIVAFVAAILAAGIYCIGMLALGRMERKSRFAFGPFLCIGIIAAVMWNTFLSL